jgi:hypothetical protein
MLCHGAYERQRESGLRKGRRTNFTLILVILSLSTIVTVLLITPSISAAHGASPARASGLVENAGSSTTTPINPLLLDSSSGTNCNPCSSLSMPLFMTSGDVVVVQVGLSPESVLSRGGGYSFLTSLTAPGLAFQNRFNYTENPGSGDGSLVWEEYAIATKTGTLTITGTVNNSMTAWSMIGYSVSGADDAHPFDNNSRLAFGTWDFNDCNLNDGCSTDFSTASLDTMVIAGIVSEGNPEFSAPANGFTLLKSELVSGWDSSAVAYRFFSSPQNDTSTGNWVLNPGESALWYADAIQGCVGSVGSCPTAVPPITLPISVEMTNSAPSSNVTVNGCYARPSMFLSDGEPHSISMLPSCSFTLSFSNAGTTRDGFSVSGSFNATSPTQSSCGTGTCTPITLTAYEQLQNTYRAKPSIPGAWDAGLEIAVVGTEAGAAGQIGCSISTVSGAGLASCTTWFDYGTQVNVESKVVVSSTEQWAQSGGASFNQHTSSNEDTVSFVDQLQIGFSATPLGAGTTTPPTSKLWEDYGSILRITATSKGDYLFNNWSASSRGITLGVASDASTTAKFLAAGNITAGFSLPITQMITLTLDQQQGTPANFTVSGCSTSLTTVLGNGKPQVIDALPSCSLTTTAESDSQDVRYVFNSGGILSSAISNMTCPAKTCSEISVRYSEQVSAQFAYTVVGGAGPYVQAPVLTYTAAGSQTAYIVTTNPTTLWLDFGTPWSLTNPLLGSTATNRWFAVANESGTVAGGHRQTTAYQHQYSVLIEPAPTDCGSTNPSGLSWVDSGQSFQIVTSGDPGCTFTAWEGTGLLTIPQQDQPSTNAFADSNGTLTASFSRNLLPTYPTSTLVAIAVAASVALISVGLVVKRRASRSKRRDGRQPQTA